MPSSKSVFIHAQLYAENRLRVASLLQNTKLKGRDKKIALFNLIMHHEVVSGTTFIVAEPDGTPYVILGLICQAMALPNQGRGSAKLFAYIYERYGLNEHEELTSFVIDGLRNFAMAKGTRVDLRRFAFFDKKTNTQYISRYNGEVFKLDGSETVTVVNNGDGVYFADDDNGKYCEEISIRPHGILLDRLTSLAFDETENGITAEQQKRALIVWLFALAFPDLMPTKPLMLFEGAPGSGKSSCSQFIQLALLGSKKPLIMSRSKEDDFGVMLLRNPIAVLDNVDSYIDWIPDAVCAYTTSGVWTKRRLYTDDEEVTIRPHAFIAVASKNPASFRREDVADRSIIIRLKRIKKHQRQDALEDRILKDRGKLLGEYLYYCNIITKEIKNGGLNEGFVDPVDKAVLDAKTQEENSEGIYADVEEEETAQEQESHRMADYVALARIVSKVLGWEDTAVDEMLRAIQNERNNLVNEDDPLSELLHLWLQKKRGVNWANYGRLVSLQELFGDLEQIAEAHNMVFYKSSRQLAQKLRSPHLENEFYIVHTKIRSQNAYKIWKQNSPRPVSDDEDSGSGTSSGGSGAGPSTASSGSKSPSLSIAGMTISGFIKDGEE